MKAKKGLAMLMLLSMVSSNAFAVVYKWKNPDGSWSYGDLPPSGVKVVPLDPFNPTMTHSKKTTPNNTSPSAGSSSTTDANKNPPSAVSENMVEIKSDEIQAMLDKLNEENGQVVADVNKAKKKWCVLSKNTKKCT